jgi:hypothetical protein
MPKKKKSERVLILKTVDKDLRSYNGFQWPESGMVAAPDWNPVAECGGGLHGFLWGCGDATLASGGEDAKWLVFAADSTDVIELSGKVKVPGGKVLLVGTKDEALAFLDANGCSDKPVIYASRTAGDRGTATAGYAGTATAGYAGTATAGYRGTATAGNRGTATAGYAGTATAGYAGTATAGYAGTATAGNRGTATAGEKGRIQIARWDTKAERKRLVVGYPGENGIRANKPYKLDENGLFVPAS